jgi:glycosyltransferase involved in cell wall biosynthesis
MLGVHRTLGTWTHKVTRYIALTEFMRAKFVAAGLSAEQVVVKPNFVARDPGVGCHGGGYALFVGRLSPEKGLGTLLRAWAHLGGRIPLKIVGDGPLRDLARGSVPGVEWLGRLDHDSAVALMKEATVLAFPSQCYEGFGMVIAEAFAAGLPVVASDLGAMAEMVVDRDTGLLFKPGDALELAARIDWTLGHPAEMKEMGCRARAEYERKYTAERNYQLLHEIYERVLERPSP